MIHAHGRNKKEWNNLESILTSVKKMLGITEEYTIFDADIITHINSVFSTLYQIGVGPKEGFSIESSTATWSDFVSDESRLKFVKSYVYLKVRMLFDPPLTSSVLTSMENMASEYEWRLLVGAEEEAKNVGV